MTVRPESARASLVAEGMDAARPHMERIEALEAENARLRALLLAARFSLQALMDALGAHTTRGRW